MATGVWSNCTECGVRFEMKDHQEYRLRKTGKAFCRKSCGMTYRSKHGRKRQPRPVEPIPKQCPVCFIVHLHPTRMTCSKQCFSKIASETMARTNRIHASERMKRNNPMSRPEIRAKMTDTIRRIGHKPKQRGGNGKPPTEAEQKLIDMLTVFGFTPQLPVRTGWGKNPGPTHYKLDMAHPTLKIAIEADGRSHEATARQQSDARKDAFLRGEGWTVLRFKNDQILNDPAMVMFTISKSMTSILTSQTG